jgi:phage shock protein A
VQEELQKFRENSSNLRSEVNTLLAKVSDLTAENNSLKSRKAYEGSGEVDTLNATIVRITAENSSKERELQSLRQEIQSLAR